VKLYVAGPMTGILGMNFPAFYQAAAALLACGYEVVNPADAGQGEGTWLDYMRRDITDLLTCDGIALLPGWASSKGAFLEVTIFKALGLPVRRLDEWLEVTTS